MLTNGAELPADIPLHQSLQVLSPQALFAARSSAVGEDSTERSFAGIHRTLLNVPATQVADAVLQCMRSARSAHADAYRSARQAPEATDVMSVLVQERVAAEVAGVAFTVDPTGEAGHLLINASWRLGEPVVSGQVDPDSFTVDRTTGAVVHRQVGTKQHYAEVVNSHTALHETPQADQDRPCLTDEQVATLAGLLLQVERAFGAPQDIEWCLAGGEFWIVQSRPITAADTRYPSLAWSRRHPDIEWSRATALESLPDLPKPQVSQAHCELIERGLRGIAPEFLAPTDDLGPVVRLILGRLYFNVSQFKHIAHAVGRPAHPVITAHGGASQAGDAASPTLSVGRNATRVAPYPALGRHLAAVSKGGLGRPDRGATPAGTAAAARPPNAARCRGVG